MLSTILRRVKRGIRRQQIKNIFVVTSVFCSGFLVALAYLQDCRLFAFSSKCEPQFIRVKLNETFTVFDYQMSPAAAQQIMTTGKVLCTTERKSTEELPSGFDVIENKSRELLSDPTFEERRDDAGQACADLLSAALDKELASTKLNRNGHVAFSVGMIYNKTGSLSNQSTISGNYKNRKTRVMLNLKNDMAEPGKPRYFQAQMSLNMNRWVHYHRIIQSSKGSRHNKVVELKWCPVFKAASTPWLALFTKLSKALTNHTEAAIKRGKMGFLELARTYRLLTPRRYDPNVHPVRSTMMVVRHPFKRLLSGYKDKIERVKGRLFYYNKYSTKIMQKFRKDEIGQLERMSKDKDFSLKIPTFREFVKYILSLQPKKLDEHWRPMFLDCNPCQKKFDFILKVETLNDDMKKILTYLHVTATDPMYKEVIDAWTRWNNPSSSHKNQRNESFYFSQLTKYEMNRLYQLYEPDFKLFEYSPEPYLSMAKNEKIKS